MAKATATTLRKITLFKPNKKDFHLVMKSLYDWADRILYWDLPYVQDITNSIEGKKKKMDGLRLMTKYTMTDGDFVSTDKNDSINVEIKQITPKQQSIKHKHKGWRISAAS